MHTSPMPESSPWAAYLALAGATVFWLSSDDGTACSASRPSSFRGKEMYALTNPEGLNFGRQTGIHEADAGELSIDGAWIVFRSM